VSVSVARDVQSWSHEVRGMAKLGRDEGELEKLGGLATACEIEQQPAMLRKTHAALAARKNALESFLRPLTHQPALRLILTGAGTSSFIGECLAPYLATRLQCRVEAIPTTDLVCAPYLYLSATMPTLLVSFGRSGSSPESVAAVELADTLVGEIHHLAITCNADGTLACRLASARNAMVMLLPEETNDRSFVMTSSFSCMTYAALAALCGLDGMQPRVERMAQAIAAIIATQAEPMRSLARERYERVVYLGSHMFKALAREAALKLLELTDGGVIAAHDSPLGFRHGPKTIVSSRTLVVLFVSNHAYTRRYDLDLLEELRRDGQAGSLLSICGRDDDIPAGVKRILIPSMQDAEDIDLLLPFIAAPQIFAFEAAIDRGLSPDNPNVAGTVSRVVQGVRIHAFR
jgi:tagatose-6-phosphate ketose/aldose isomerase